MDKVGLISLLLVLISCASKEEKGKIVIVNEVKQRLSYPESFELISLDTLDCYSDTKHCILRITFQAKTDSLPSVTDLSFIALNHTASIVGFSEDLRALGDFVKLSTYHKYAKNIDFGSKHLIGDFDIVTTEELKKIDLASRGFIR